MVPVIQPQENKTREHFSSVVSLCYLPLICIWKKPLGNSLRPYMQVLSCTVGKFWVYLWEGYKKCLFSRLLLLRPGGSNHWLFLWNTLVINVLPAWGRIKFCKLDDFSEKLDNLWTPTPVSGNYVAFPHPLNILTIFNQKLWSNMTKYYTIGPNL